MSKERRLRLGFFMYLEGERTQAEAYRDSLDVFVAADQLGFDVGWVAQHHFGHHGGLPSPIVFFASLAERTRHLGVGTAIISLPFENPIRVAEDAAVFEALYPGRLQLGIGTGFGGPAVLAAFNRAGGDRRSLYDDAIIRLLGALSGQPVTEDGDLLNPPAPELLDRIWEAPSTLERVAESAHRRSGLLLSRIAIGAGTRPSHELQVPMVEKYLAELPAGVAPRIGLSRTVYPSRRPDVAFRDLSAGLEASIAAQTAQGIAPLDFTLAELFTHHNIHFGAPDAVIESLRREPLIDQVTDLICQVQPGLPSIDQTLDALELIATEVAPALGWKAVRAGAEAALTP